MLVPLATLTAAVQLVDSLAELDDPARFGEVVGPALAGLISGEASDVDRAVLDALRGPLAASLARTRARAQARAALADSPPRLATLSERERQVMTLVALGCTNAAIAHVLQISPRTVAKHLERAYPKLGVTCRAAAAACTAAQPSAPGPKSTPRTSGMPGR
jgi:DNA-binding NarL/FixJ family response regulator